MQIINKLYYPVNNDSKRMYFFDNLKFLLITLVVIGHFLSNMYDFSYNFKGIYTFIYTFHMPLFIFVTGYFSKSFIKNGEIRIGKVISYFVLYLFLYSFFYLIDIFILGKNYEVNYLYASGLPWYLLVTCFYYISILVLRKVKFKYSISISIIFALLIGYCENIQDFLAIQRAVVFFPFFILGYYINKDKINKILNSKFIFRIIALIILILFFALCMNKGINMWQFKKLVTGRNYYSIFLDNNFGFLYRFVYYIVVCIIGISFMLVTPRCKTFFSEFGSRTVQVYSLHLPIINIMAKYGFFEFFKNQIFIVKFIPFIVAIILTFILSLKIFSYPFNLIFKNNYTKKIN